MLTARAGSDKNQVSYLCRWSSREAAIHDAVQPSLPLRWSWDITCPAEAVCLDPGGGPSGCEQPLNTLLPWQPPPPCWRMGAWKASLLSARGSSVAILQQPPHSVQFNSVPQSCLTLCYPMDCSTPGFPVHHQLPELAQTHVHEVGDAIQPFHPLSSPSPAFSLSQHQGVFQ